MKMKLLTVTTIACLTMLGYSAPEKNLLQLAQERDAKVVAAQAALDAATTAAASAEPPGTVDPKLAANLSKAQGDAVDYVAALIGPTWREAWAASTLPDPDDILADRYMAAPFDLRPIWKFSAHGIIQAISPTKRVALLDFIAAKPALIAQDVEVIRYAGIHRPTVAARMAEIATFLPSGGIRGEEYYRFRNSCVLCQPGYWTSNMKVSEWIDLAMQPAHFSPATFTAGRDKVMLKLAQLLIEKRQAQDLPTEGAEFDAAFVPILAALKAPKFSGLREIVAGLELPIALPAELDWSAQEAVATVVQEAAERNGTFLTSWGATVPYAAGLGSVMFVKGEAAYEAWRLATIAND
jgi:hypothetical protein